MARPPVVERLGERQAVLGGLAQRAAHDGWPSVGGFEHPQHVGVRERHAAGLRHVANSGRIEREPLGVAERRRSLRDQAPDLERPASAARDQQADVVGELFDQTQDRADAALIRLMLAVQRQLHRSARRECLDDLVVRAELRFGFEGAGDRGPDLLGRAVRGQDAVESVGCGVAQIPEQRHGFAEAGGGD